MIQQMLDALQARWIESLKRLSAEEYQQLGPVIPAQIQDAVTRGDVA